MNTSLKFLLCGLLSFGLASCSDNDKTGSDTTTFETDLNGGRIELGADAGSASSFRIRSDARWEIRCEGDLFTASPTTPTGFETEVVVTASEANPEDGIRKLGGLTISCPEADRLIDCEVVQLPESAAATTPQTLLLYMPGTSLVSYYEANIDLCRKAVADRALGKGRLLVCYQPGGNSSAELLELRFDDRKNECVTDRLRTYEHFDAASQKSVRRLFSDMEEFAPAQRYGLVIGSHGKAWIPAGITLTSRTGHLPADEEEFWAPKAGAKPTRSFGDTHFGMEIPDLSAVLSSLDFRFDFLMFDACFMSNIETLYDLRTNTDYIVASPCEIMGAGFPYDTIIPHLFAQTPLEERLAGVCNAYWYFYMHDWETNPLNEPSGCIALTRTAELDALAEAMRQVSAATKKDYDPAALQYYEGLSEHVFFDLGHYVELSCADDAARTRFKQQFDRTFPPECRLHTEIFYSVYNGMRNPIHYYSGVSVSEPCTRYTVENRNTAWYKATH